VNLKNIKKVGTEKPTVIFENDMEIELNARQVKKLNKMIQQFASA